jgi:hypothetical protein
MKKCIWLLIALVLVGCNDYLDIKPYGKTIPVTTEEFSALVHDICDGIDKGTVAGGEIVGDYRNTGTMEAITDNVATNLTAGSDRLRTYIGQDLSSKQQVYTNLYQQIRNCNIILGEYKDGRDSREGRDIVGAVYAIRGVCYYQLLRQFCAPPLAMDAKLGVPLVTEFDMEAMPVRSTMQETISQAEHDLKTALTYDVQNEMYLFNNDVVHGYLARLYHWCGRWEEARSEARCVLAKHPLLSGDDYVKMMSTQYGLTGNKLLVGNRLSDSSTQQGISGSMSAQEERPLSADLVQLFVEGTNDIRRKNNLFFNRKRKNRKLFFSGMRSAEMALVAMECAYHLNKQDTALAELNEFRSKRILTDDYAYTMETLPAVNTKSLIQQDATGAPLTPLLQAILNERRKELYLENGDRWFELKRNGRPEFWVADSGMKYWTRSYMYTYPISLSDIQVQPALVQNPGYEETY